MSAPQQPIQSHILSVLVDNEPGILARVVGLFSGRGYNLDSLTVAPVDDTGRVSRITVVTSGTEMVIEQIKAQLDRLVPVHRVQDLTMEGPHLERELALIKVDAMPEARATVISTIDIFRAKVVDVGKESLTAEITGDQSKVDAFIELMRPFGIREIVRTGLTALERGNKEIKEHKKFEED